MSNVSVLLSRRDVAELLGGLEAHAALRATQLANEDEMAVLAQLVAELERNCALGRSWDRRYAVEAKALRGGDQLRRAELGA